jgi:hypothetical protein
MRTFAAELREEKISTRTIDMNRMKRWMLMMAVLPRKALYDLISERVGFFANWQATKELSLELSSGVNIPFYGRVRDISHPHIYMKLHADVKPYVQLKLNYSIKKD